MAEEFQPITTQEELNATIQDRLNRQNAKHAEEINQLNSKYADYDALKTASEESSAKLASLTEELEKLKADSAGYSDTIKAKDAEIAKYAREAAKTSIAIETGLPIELASRLTGETEEDMKKDALNLLKVVGTRTTAPMANSEKPEEDGVMAAFRKLNPNIKI